MENRHFRHGCKIEIEDEQFDYPVLREKDALAIKKMESEPLPSSQRAGTVEIYRVGARGWEKMRSIARVSKIRLHLDEFDECPNLHA
ncbi:hypothetical protein Nepgr_006291 [Nepenthes gracilis]|uniref:Uncharacterized protein n=1 Tax=Nepenthes gracilis TaxID=150966 RepID=A0AAD3XH77_NEPGR|nr:hypothetical protein Nepgr_006291 [Nepenthes gracilis]